MTRRKMRRPKKAKRAMLPHGAYVMMIRSLYDLYPKRKRKTW